MEPEFFIVLSTVDSEETADRIATALVEEHLAACVNVVPAVRSTYRWEGKIAREEELLLIIKTTSAALDNVKSRVKALHTYDLPEIVALPIADGLEAYLDWIRASVS